MTTHPTIDNAHHVTAREKLATLLSSVGAAIALVAIVYSAWQLNRTQAAVLEGHAELRVLERRRAEAVQALEQLQRATAEQEKVLRDLANRAATGGEVPDELVVRATQSLELTQRASERATAIVPIVGLLLAGEWQRPAAERVANELRLRGFRIQVVRPLRGNAKAARGTAVRHYRSANDPGDALQISELLEKQFGVSNVEIETASEIDSPPNKYEIWFGQTAFASSR